MPGDHRAAKLRSTKTGDAFLVGARLAGRSTLPAGTASLNRLPRLAGAWRWQAIIAQRSCALQK